MTEPVQDEGVAIHRDVVHTQVDGYRPLALDLYVPTHGAHRVVIYLHGGGWRRGSRRHGPGPLGPTSNRLFLRAAQQGLAVASIDYRLSAEAQFPAQCHDVDAACSWLALNRDRFGLGDGPLTLWGVSAGGTLAALRALEADSSPGVAATALWYAVSDLRSMPGADLGTDADGRPTPEARLIGGTPASLPELAAAASPVAQVRAGAPPFLLLHGDHDVLVPAEQSEQLSTALSSVGVPATLEIARGWGHMFSGMPDAQVEALVDRTVGFLLGADGSPPRSTGQRLSWKRPSSG